MNVLSVAIIGAGNIAGGFDENKREGEKGVYSHAGAYSLHGGFKIRSVLDLDKDKAVKFKKYWNVGQAVNELQDICKMHHDLVSVCSPDDTHLDIVLSLIKAKCCKTVFVEKPLITDIEKYDALVELAHENKVNIVVNFQRRNEPVHFEIQEYIKAHPDSLLSVTGRYMKGLHHIGVTLIDTLCYFCGIPDAVMAYNRAWNEEVEDYSYEFILFFSKFAASVQSIDSERFSYNYHLFEIDLLFHDKRQTLIDLSQALRESNVSEYAYSGVKVMNDSEASIRETGYHSSMLDAVSYLHDVTCGQRPHTINTPDASYNNLLIIRYIIDSFDRGFSKLYFKREQWKR